MLAGDSDLLTGEFSVARKTSLRRIGVLTGGGDCPGLNAVIRAVTKTAIHEHEVEVLGIRDAFRGFVEGDAAELSYADVSGILTEGGTILGTSRHVPEFMPSPQGPVDRTQEAIDSYHLNNLDTLIIIGDNKTGPFSQKLFDYVAGLQYGKVQDKFGWVEKICKA